MHTSRYHCGADLLVAHRRRHSMTLTDNPFCPRCGVRLYPQWGAHECKTGEVMTEDEVKRIRHVAGDIISNLHFYRIEPAAQIEALAEALAFTVAGNVRPAGVKAKLAAIATAVAGLTQIQMERQAKGTNSENLVMDVDKPRLRAKVKKGHTDDRRQAKGSDRQDRQAVPARGTRRHGRAKGNH